MATIEQETQTRNTLKGVLDELVAFKPSDLARKDLGADVNFEGGVIFFSRTLRLFQALQEADLEDIPYTKLAELLSAATQTRDRLARVKAFSFRQYQANPLTVRDQFIGEVRDSYDGIFNNVSPVVAFTIRKGTDFLRLEEEARATLQKIDLLSTDHETALAKARVTAGELLQEMMKLAQEAGVTKQAVHFKTEADKHETAAKQWLIATVVLGILSLGAGVASWMFFARHIGDLSTTQNLQLTVSKIIILSLMFSATVWAGKTYRAHRHNAVVNRHRQNALSTFKAFVEATTDEPTKNAVLLQATQCIFAPQQTGYVSTGDSDSSGVPQVLEIVRTLGKNA